MTSQETIFPALLKAAEKKLLSKPLVKQAAFKGLGWGGERFTRPLQSNIDDVAPYQITV